MQQLKALNEEMLSFFTPLWPGEDKSLVFGDGKSEKPVFMLVGEAPGEQETIQKKPFVGKAGKNLDEFLRLAQLERKEIYVSNVVKIRPTEKGKTGRTRNRAPNKEELALFTPFLMRETEIIRPRIIVTLGNVPLQAFMGKKCTVGEYHGKLHKTEQGFSLFSLYHPASIIYRPELKEVYVQDVLALKELQQSQT